MQFVFIAYLPCVVALAAIGLLILLKNPRSTLNKSFFLLTLNLVGWLLALFVGDLVINYDISLWSVRTAAAIGTLLGPQILLFASNFPLSISPLRRRIIYTVYMLAFVLAALTFTPYMIPTVELVNNSAQPRDVGLLYSLQTLYLVVCWLIATYVVIKKYRKVGARERSQIKVVVLGILVMLAVNLGTGYVLTALGVSNNYSNFIGSVSILAFVGTTAYAIFQYRLFDIRLAIVRFIGYALTVTIVSTLYSFGVIIIGANLVQMDPESYRPMMFVLIVTTLIVSLTFHRLHGLMNRLTMRIFYQNSYSTREVLEKLSDELLMENSIDNIMRRSLDVITPAIRPSSYAFVTIQGNEVYKQTHSHTKPDSELVQKVIKRLLHIRSIVVERGNITDAALLDALQNIDVEVVLRLGNRMNPTGLLLFGTKKNGRMYTSQDIELLRIAAKNLTIAVDNAHRYEQIQNFNNTLKEEVAHATSRLKHANERLKTLDELKDDFISMASHQFRTPAGSIHQALRMLSNPNLSEEDRREMLKLAEADSEQLVTLVGTMLSISRLQAGRFVLSKTPADLTRIVDKVIQITQVLADQKNITITYRRPDTPLQLEVDEAKVREAVTNYVENAIKYSPAGSTVTLTVESRDGQAVLEVADQGMGVPEDERTHLFGKFYRAKNARKEQPDGNGIGLYVVKSIAEMHGGKAYYTPLERGSMFGIALPLPKDNTSDQYTTTDHGNSLIH